MFNNLLVPLDLTDRHQPVLDIAVELAQKNNGQVTLLHVIENIPGLSFDEEKGFFQNLERTAQSHLRKLSKVVTDRGVVCRQKVLYGSRARQVADFAAEMGADLIVLTSPCFDPENPAVSWGSLSYKVGFLSRCPVLLAK